MKKKIITFLNSVFDFIFGFLILLIFYFISFYLLRLLKINFPPAVIGLVLFSLALILGIVKEKRIKSACNFLINNMAMFLVPFIVGLISYKAILEKNFLIIFLAVFLVTTFVIVTVGLFVENGLKYLRLYRIRKLK